ncbi:hypothetical protein [Paenibacillus sp. MMS20-IR301]|uniref:hypothetical protein n=1 Tax=Paenibacillus sp. MMS20-IR301 TaxID=2895946 RepID=UPI0028E8428C|nr:hypothetical protein [Paenibacillus sp. MMS20-IR301]WNS42474.1 hypothetical protein LOS79_26355 [Paenibacillus sp. MMS20-IR301]
MKKSYHVFLIGTYILIILAGIVWHAGGVSAEDTIKLTVNSHTTSAATMNNMQPGDTMDSAYTVINDGNEPFNYSVNFKFLSGDVELYNILQMTLQKEGVTIYSGVMSKAEGQVVIGSLEGNAKEAIQMDVLFPPEAGNEFQGKQVSVAFEFSASAKPGPTAEPTAEPTATVTPEPTATPAATATPEITNAPSSAPTATNAPTDPPAGSPAPGTTPTPAPAPTPAATPTATPDAVTVSEAPIPLGGGDDGGNNGPAATAAAGTDAAGSTAAPGTDNEVTLPDDELPLAGPDGDSALPDTAEPWYNLILASLAVAILSVIALRKLGSKK